MIIGYFDYGVLVLLVIANIYFWRKNLNRKIGYLIIGLLFGIVLPIISMIIEITRISREYEIIEGFNLVYAIFRFPMYWIIGIFQTIVMHVNNKKRDGNTH